MPEIKVPFGLATITIGDVADTDKLVFDGANYFQADGGEVSIAPILQEIQIADFGESVYDDVLNGWEGTVTVVAAQRDLAVLQKAMMATDRITDTAAPATTVGLTDARIGTSLRTKGKQVRIHPRNMGADASLDIVIYKMASVGEFTDSFANEQGQVEMEFKMYPRDNADADKAANFFYIGSTDPNAAP